MGDSTPAGVKKVCHPASVSPSATGARQVLAAAVGGFATLLLSGPVASRMFGGGGMNPRKMQQMMKQMGIDVTEIDAEEVVIRTADEELVFDGAQVTRMDAQGQQTYQIVGDPETRELGAGSTEERESDDADEGSDAGIPDSDVELVAQRAGVGRDEARAALEAAEGDLAAAIAELE
jgi:nascent polypeptide-associated complex subunit alpha